MKRNIKKTKSINAKNIHELIEQLTSLLLNSNVKIDGFQVTYSQMKTLLTLSNKNPCTMGELKKMSGASFSAITVMIRRLSREGLVERKQNRKDKRIVNVYLTLRGRRKVKRFRALSLRYWEDVLSRLSIDNEKRLLAGLQSVVNILIQANTEKET